MAFSAAASHDMLRPSTSTKIKTSDMTHLSDTSCNDNVQACVERATRNGCQAAALHGQRLTDLSLQLYHVTSVRITHE